MEIEVPYEGDGYAYTPGAPFGPSAPTILAEYSPSNPLLNSAFSGGGQKLENGHILTTSASLFWLVEHDENGNLVWDFDARQLQLDRPESQRGGQIFKAQKYPLDYSGLSRLTSITLEDSYDAWRESVFGSTDLPGTGILDDLDLDGIENLAEYALGMDPQNSAAGELSNLPEALSEAEDKFVVEYTRIEGNFSNEPFSYEYSTDLLNWRLAVPDVDYAEQVTDNQNGTENVLVRFTKEEGSGMFFRLSISAK